MTNKEIIEKYLTGIKNYKNIQITKDFIRGQSECFYVVEAEVLSDMFFTPTLFTFTQYNIKNNIVQYIIQESVVETIKLFLED